MAARLTARAATAVAGVLTLAIGLAACGTGGGGPVPTTPAPTPRVTLSPAVGPTVAAVTQALGDAGLQVASAQVAHRPPESPDLAVIPRWTLQVDLPAEPTHGFITIYDLADARAAQAAGEAQAAYVASGPGRAQFPEDTRFAIRRLGSTVVFYSWSPGSGDDPRAPEVIPALERVGTEIPVPN